MKFTNEDLLQGTATFWAREYGAAIFKGENKKKKEKKSKS